MRAQLVEDLRRRYHTLPEAQQQQFLNAVMAADAKSGQNFAADL